MRCKLWLAPAALLAPRIGAVFIDDAFHIDYHQALLGFPQSHTTFFHKPQTASNASLLYTISDKAILGAVNPRDGSIVWRQALAGQPLEHAAETSLIAGHADGKITSAFGTSVSSWDALSGRLNWEYDFGEGRLVKSIQVIPNLAQELEGVVQDIVAVVGPHKDTTAASVVRLTADGTTPRWEFRDKSAGSDTSFAIATTAQYVYYITRSPGIMSGGKAKVVVLDVTTGKESSQYSVSVDAESLAQGRPLHAHSTGGVAFLLSSEKPHKTFRFNLLGNSKSTTITLEDNGEEIENLAVHVATDPDLPPRFLVHVRGKTRHWAEVFHIEVKSGEVTKAYSLPATTQASTFTATAVGRVVYFVQITESEILMYSSESPSHVGRWPRPAQRQEKLSTSLHATAEISRKGVSGFAIRVALTSHENGWSLVQNGDQSWSRPEMLSYITQAIWCEDVKETSLAQEIEMEATSNPMTAYVHRLSRHLQDLRYLPQYLTSISSSSSQHGDYPGQTTRERLAGSRHILAATSRGDLISIDATRAGHVRWAISLLDDRQNPIEAVYLTSAEGRGTVYLSDGQFIVVELVTGLVVDRYRSQKPFGKISQMPGEFATSIIRVSAAGVPEVFSELAPAVPREGNVLVTVSEDGEAIGWSVGASVERIWSLRPEAGAKISDIIARPPHDPVASIGTILGDRSVLYKYINPNVALLTALSSTALTVYIVNAITGAVLHTATHPGVLAEMPISAVGSGHKFVYTFTSRDPVSFGISSQVVVCDLFEADVANDRGLLAAQTNYSSFSPDAGANPHVQTIAFTVAEPISNLTVSQTSQGITSRQVIGYLSHSHSVVAIPSEFLNTRRPVGRDPTSEELEEGLFRYSPILDLDPKFFLSHSLDVVGIKKMMTAHTLLESTSLVFGFGHDVFGTQLAPSNTFDVLGKGFNRIQLLLTVVALYLGVLGLRPIVRQKMVERLWQ